MAQHLFVYGTLMSGAGHRMGARLQREARLVGLARIKGRLYDLGAYPALVETGPADGDVHGEVFELIDPSRSLRWLDAYEGIVPGREAHSEYARVERTVRLEDGRELTAWFYIYRAPVHGRPIIESGRWLSRPRFQSIHRRGGVQSQPS